MMNVISSNFARSGLLGVIALSGIALVSSGCERQPKQPAASNATQPAEKRSPLAITPTDVAKFRRDVATKPSFFGAMTTTDRHQGVDSWLAGLRQRELSRSDSLKYVEFLSGGDTKILTRMTALENFGQLPETLRRAVMPAVFALVAHNNIAERRRAIAELLAHGDSEARTHVQRLILSPSPVITKLVVDGSQSHPEFASPEQALMDVVATHQFRAASPNEAWESHMEAEEELELPDGAQKIDEVRGLIDEYARTADSADRDALIPYLYSIDWRVRVATLEGIRELPEGAYEKIGPCVPGFLTDGHPTVRIKALEVLCAQEPVASAALLELLRFSVYKEISAAAACGD